MYTNWQMCTNVHKLEMLNGELGAALGAATLEDEAPLVGGHPSAEAVDADAFVFFGLEGSFHMLCVNSNFEFRISTD